MTRPALSLLSVLLVGFALTSGCDKKQETKVQPPTQVAAKVNSEEITVHQVNFILGRTQNPAPEAAGAAKRETLEKLIDQQLARQRAIETRLDRSPEVLLAIEASRSEILARAYLQQVAAAVVQPEDREIKKYYSEHPELFERRRLFELDELAMTANPDVVPALREEAKRRSMQEIARWLQARGVMFVQRRGVRSAEQITLDVLPRIQGMTPGEIQVFEMPGGRVQLIRMVSFKEEPMSEANASQRIRQFLFNRRSGEIMANEIKRMRADAKIQYMGEFAGGASEPKDGKTKPDSEGNGRPQ